MLIFHYPRVNRLNNDHTMIPKFRHKKQFLGHNGAVFCLSKDSSRGFYSCGSDGMLVHWEDTNKEDGRLVARINTSVYAMLCMAEEQVFLTGNLEGNLQWIQEGAERFNFKAHTKGIYAIENLGDQFLSLGGDGRLGIWSWKNPKSPLFIQLSDSALRTALFSRVDHKVYIGSSDGNIYVLDAKSMTLIHTMEEAHANSVFTLCVSKDGTSLFSGSRDNFIKCWNRNDYSLEHVVPAHAATINHLVNGPDGVLISAGRDKEIRIWSAKSLELYQVLKAPRDQGHVNSVNRLLWDSKASLLYSTGDDKSIICWEIG